MVPTIRREVAGSCFHAFLPQVSTGTGDFFNRRANTTIQLLDIAEYEPRATFFGDLDPLSRRLLGQITLQARNQALGLFGYRLYPTADGDTNLPLYYSEYHTESWEQYGTPGAPFEDAQFSHNLHRHCPPDSANSDWTALGATAWGPLTQDPCGNDNPYSPVCVGKSCAFLRVMRGSEGEFYISRFDNIGPGPGSGENSGAFSAPNTQTRNDPVGPRNYSHNEFAQIYLPKSGWLTPVILDINEKCDQAAFVWSQDGGAFVSTAGCRGDTLDLETGSPGVFHATVPDLREATVGDYIDLVGLGFDATVLTWRTDREHTDLLNTHSSPTRCVGQTGQTGSCWCRPLVHGIHHGIWEPLPTIFILGLATWP